MTFSLGNVLWIGTVFLFLGWFIEKWLTDRGLVRKNLIGIILISYFSAFTKLYFVSDNSITVWFFWSLATILGLLFGIHRVDLWYSMEKGPRWWK